MHDLIPIPFRKLVWVTWKQICRLVFLEHFQNHKKFIKELVDTDGQETQAWRKEISDHISNISERIGKQLEIEHADHSMNQNPNQMFNPLADMNRNGLQDRDMLLKEISALKNRETMPLHSTPSEIYEKFQTPMNQQQNEESPLAHQTHLSPMSATVHPPG